MNSKSLIKLSMGLHFRIHRVSQIVLSVFSDCLSACPLTIHALLHVVDGMEAAGPVWTRWAFPTERFCGRLLPEIRSRRHPFSNIDSFVVASNYRR